MLILISLPLTGTSIIVFGRLPNITASPGDPAATFTIDDGNPTAFNTVPPVQRNTIYQVPIFQSPNLNLGQHTLQIESHDNNQNLWIDFIMYTQPTNLTSIPGSSGTSPGQGSPTTSPSAVGAGSGSTSHVGTIAGGVVGGVGGFVLLLALAIWLWRRKASSQKAAQSEFSPFVLNDESNKPFSSQTMANTNDPLADRFLPTHVSSPSWQYSNTSGFSGPSAHDAQSSSAALTAGQPVQTSAFQASRKPPLRNLEPPARVDREQEAGGDALPPPYRTENL
ncbi:hypothetical protein AX17_005508 [Amanita inopinata Kibby_2008]|nr:hypothetical protein AX17_005508 [Amanita inopinata Kibby_2008]